LSRLQLVAGPPGPFSRHPGFLLCATAALGLGRLAHQKDATLGRSCALYSPFRRSVVSGARRASPLYWSSVFRRADATTPRYHVRRGSAIASRTDHWTPSRLTDARDRTQPFDSGELRDAHP